jgi:hypothetical protein
MANLVLCDACGLETDIANSPVCSNCGAEVNLCSVSGQEKIVTPTWGTLMISIAKLDENEKEGFLAVFRDIWSKAEINFLSTLLPPQGKLLLVKKEEYELLCHSGVAYKVDQELMTVECRDLVNIEFKETEEVDFWNKVKILKAQ